jgi:hypothetical protein
VFLHHKLLVLGEFDLVIQWYECFYGQAIFLKCLIPISTFHSYFIYLWFSLLTFVFFRENDWFYLGMNRNRMAHKIESFCLYYSIKYHEKLKCFYYFTWLHLLLIYWHLLSLKHQYLLYYSIFLIISFHLNSIYSFIYYLSFANKFL